MSSNKEIHDQSKDEDDPITGVIGDSGKYQLLICSLIAFLEVCEGSQSWLKTNVDSFIYDNR